MDEHAEVISLVFLITTKPWQSSIKTCMCSPFGPPGGVPSQVEEGSDRWSSSVVQSSLQPPQSAAQREAPRAGEEPSCFY